MFLRYKKKEKPLSNKALKNLSKIRVASELFADEKRKQLLEKIDKSIALDDLRRSDLCTYLLEHIATQSQNLPEARTAYYAYAGGVLDHILNRTEAALFLFQQYLLNESTTLSEEQLLWQYVLFSASLLQGCGKIHGDYEITIHDNLGTFLEVWKPCCEEIIPLGDYYQYEFKHEAHADFISRLNLLSAQFLMPKNGFAWIASNDQTLAVWLALLDEEFENAGTLGAILIRAEAIAIQRDYDDFLLRHLNQRIKIPSTFSINTPDDIGNIEKKIGIEFIQWLIKMIESKGIMLNKAPLLCVPGGLLIHPDIFKFFIQEHPQFKSWQAIQKGLLSLNMHRLSSDGSIYSRFELNANQSETGILLSNYASILPSEVELSLSNNESIRVSAVEFIHLLESMALFNRNTTLNNVVLPHLSVTGEWQLPQAHRVLAQSEVMKRD